MADEQEEPTQRASELFRRFLDQRDEDPTLTIERFADRYPEEQKQLLRMWKWSLWFDAWRAKRGKGE